MKLINCLELSVVCI